MDQCKLSSVYQETNNPHTKIKLQKKKKKFSYTAIIRKGNSKPNLLPKKSDTNIRKSFDKSSSNENNKIPISQQINQQQR